MWCRARAALTYCQVTDSRTSEVRALPGPQRLGQALLRLGTGSFAFALLLLLALPLLSLLFSGTPGALLAALADGLVRDAMWLSAKTTLLSLLVVALLGTPLAWRLARGRFAGRGVLEVLIALPIVLPPSVLGIALLQTFGRAGLLSEFIAIPSFVAPFSTGAVVVAQVVVSAPFFVQAAIAGFRAVDEDMILVARTLGASPARAFLRVAVPAAMPSLLTGLALSWARALGEFGATLLFAGHMPNRTQTMPLAIYAALESNVDAARAMALVLAGTAFMVLLLLRTLPRVRGGLASAWRSGGSQ